MALELFSSVRYDPALKALSLDPQDAALASAGWNLRQASPFYMLDLHRDRLLRAAVHWHWPAAVATMTGDAGLARLQAVLETAVASSGAHRPLRCRVSLDADGRLHGTAAAVPETPLVGLLPASLPPAGFMASQAAGEPAWDRLRAALGQTPYEVVLDADGTAASVYTHYKTTRRQMYEEARRRAGIALTDRKEVLLVHAATGAVMDGSIATVYLWRGGRWVTPPVPAVFGGQAADNGGLDGTTRRWALERGLAVQETVLADSLADGEECWLSNGVRGFLYGKISLSRP